MRILRRVGRAAVGRAASTLAQVMGASHLNHSCHCRECEGAAARAQYVAPKGLTWCLAPVGRLEMRVLTARAPPQLTLPLGNLSAEPARSALYAFDLNTPMRIRSRPATHMMPTQALPRQGPGG